MVPIKQELIVRIDFWLIARPTEVLSWLFVTYIKRSNRMNECRQTDRYVILLTRRKCSLDTNETCVIKTIVSSFRRLALINMTTTDFALNHNLWCNWLRLDVVGERSDEGLWAWWLIDQFFWLVVWCNPPARPPIHSFILSIVRPFISHSPNKFLETFIFFNCLIINLLFLRKH